MRPDIEAIIKKNSNKPYVPNNLEFGGKTLTKEEKEAKSVCDK
jgi:hypothetical protein